MKKLIIFGLVMLCLIGSVNAVLVDSFTGGTNNNNFGSSEYRKIATSFNSTADYYIETIAIELKRSDTITQGQYLWLYNVDGTDKPTTILTRSTNSVGDADMPVVGTYYWLNFTLLNKVKLANTTNYAWAIGNQTAQPTDRLTLKYKTGGGQHISRWNGTVWILGLEARQNFKTYGEILGNFTITAKDVYNSSSINNFNVEIDGYANYSTTTGTITTDINTSQIYDITFWNITNYLNRTYTNYNTSTNLNGEIYPYTKIYAQSALSGTYLDNFTITYDGTEYLTTSGTVELPLYNETAELKISNVYNKSLQYTDKTVNVSVSPYLQNYTFEVYPNPSIFNITFYDEQTNNLIKENVSVLLSITSDNGGNVTNLSFSDNVAYIDTLTNGLYRINYKIDGYYENNYYYNVDYDSYNELRLYAMPINATPTDLYLNIKNSFNYNDYSNLIVKLQRKYLTENVWNTVQMDKTGQFGYAYFKVLELYTDYRFIYQTEDGVVLETTDEVKFACGGSICEAFFVVSPIGIAEDDITLNIDYTVINQSNLTIIWNDPIGTSHNINFRLTKDSITGVIEICEINQTGASGTGYCNITGYTGEGRAMFSLNSDLYELTFIKLDTPLLGTLLGKEEGMFYAIAFTATGGLAGLYSPIGAIVMVIIGLVIGVLFGLATPLNLAFIISVSVIGIIIGIRIKK